MDDKPVKNIPTIISEMLHNFLMDPNYSEYRNLTLAMIVLFVLVGMLLAG